MNIFRLTGDLSHLAAIIILLLKIWKTRSCAGECSYSLTFCVHDPSLADNVCCRCNQRKLSALCSCTCWSAVTLAHPFANASYQASSVGTPLSGEGSRFWFLTLSPSCYGSWLTCYVKLNKCPRLKISSVKSLLAAAAAVFQVSPVSVMGPARWQVS